MSQQDSKRFNPYRQFVGAFIPLWLLTSTEIHAGAKLVYARLAMFAGKNGHCFPSVATVGTATGIGVRTVQRHIKELEDAGFIEREEIKGVGCRYYFLQHPCQNGTGDSTPDKMAPDPCQNGTQRDSIKTNTLSKKGARMIVSWGPSLPVREWAIDTAKANGLDEKWLGEELETFRDYWLAVPGQRGVKLNWDATFRNWIRKGIEFKRDRRNHATNRTTTTSGNQFNPAEALDKLIG